MEISEWTCGEKFRENVWREMEIESLGINGEGKCGETCRGEVYGGIQMGSVGRNGKCVERN